MTLLDGGDWWGQVEFRADALPEGFDDDKRHRWIKVVAWERCDVDGKHEFRGWLNGSPIVASDVLSESAWFINHYEQVSSAEREKRIAEERWRDFIWA